MTTYASTAVERYQPVVSEAEQATLLGFLAGYRGFTREAYTLDLRQFAAWCWQHDLRLFDVRRIDIECFARNLKDRGRARATVARRLSTVVGFYRYAEEEGVIAHSPAVHVRRPSIDYESHVAHLDRNAELDGRADRAAHVLSELGLVKGDRVAVLLPNCHQVRRGLLRRSACGARRGPPQLAAGRRGAGVHARRLGGRRC
jgi:hypothetical protein